MKICGILKSRKTAIQTALLSSSNWNNAANAGTFNVNANNATSNSNDNIGSQLVSFVNDLCTLTYPAPWQNITMNKHCAGRA